MVDPRRVDDQLPDGLRAAGEPLADLSPRVAEAVRSAPVSGPAAFPGSDVFTRYAEQVSAVPRLWVEPLRLSDVTDSWSDLLRPGNAS